MHVYWHFSDDMGLASIQGECQTCLLLLIGWIHLVHNISLNYQDTVSILPHVYLRAARMLSVLISDEKGFSEIAKLHRFRMAVFSVLGVVVLGVLMHSLVILTKQGAILLWGN